MSLITVIPQGPFESNSRKHWSQSLCGWFLDPFQAVSKSQEASDDELEAEYQEAVAMMTVAKQRRAEVDSARQFFREPQSLEGRKAQLDKLSGETSLSVARALSISP